MIFNQLQHIHLKIYRTIVKVFKGPKVSKVSKVPKLLIVSKILTVKKRPRAMRSRFFSFWPDGRRVSSKGYFGYFRALTADKYPALGIGHHAALQVVELNGSIGISLSRNPLYSGQRTVRTDI